jgi:glycosyltransferase involved in cell wall biosynthesis
LGRGWSAFKYRIADAVAAVSCEVADSLAAAGLDREMIEVIHSGIRPRAYGKREGGRTRDMVVFGLIGAFTPQKGVEMFLKALAEVRRMRPDLKWLGLVVGEGPLWGELEDLAVKLGIDDAVSFPGYVDSREVLCEMDVLAVPSMHGEGSSGTIKEGWASRVPVVCSDLPANLELVEHDETGLVVPRGEEKALAEALVRLADDEELSERLAARGAESVKGFTVRRMAEAYKYLYESLLK